MAITDHGHPHCLRRSDNTRPDNQKPITIYRTFSIQVRDMDIDWDDAGNDGVDDGQGNYTESQTFTVQARDTAADAQATPEAPSDTHTFTLIPVQGYNPNTATPQAATQVGNRADFTTNNQFRTMVEGNVFGDVFGTFTIAAGNKSNKFTVTYTVKEDNEEVQRLGPTANS